MNKLHIFIETTMPRKGGKVEKRTNEYCFIEQYLQYLIPEIRIEDFDITGVGGKDNLKNHDNAMQQNSAKHEKNIVIFDCDSPETDGGLSKRIKQMEELKKEFNMEFDYFLFPNNKDNGTFEDLLLHIVNPQHKGLLDCFEGYEMCIKGCDNDNLYQTPNKKAKIYSYITSFRRSRKEDNNLKNGDWNFKNSQYWRLDAEYLSPLKSFILKKANNEEMQPKNK